MDGEGARALSWRIEQQEHWRQAGAVLDGRQPSIDPDRDSLESVGDGIRLYRARSTRHGMVQLRKHLVDGLWELEMIDVIALPDAVPSEPDETPVYQSAQIYDLGSFGSAISAPAPSAEPPAVYEPAAAHRGADHYEAPDVYEPPAVPEPYEPPAAPDRYLEAPAAFSPSGFSSDEPDPYEQAGSRAADRDTLLSDHVVEPEPYLGAAAAFTPAPEQPFAPGELAAETPTDLPAWGGEHSQGPFGSGPNSDELAAVVDELAAVADQLAPFPDELAAVVDELAAVADQLAPFPDELAAVVDELGAVPDEYASVPDELAAVVKELAAVQQELAAVQEELSAVPRILPVLPTELDIAQYDLTSVRRELAAVRDELAVPRTRADDDASKISRVA